MSSERGRWPVFMTTVDRLKPPLLVRSDMTEQRTYLCLQRESLSMLVMAPIRIFRLARQRQLASPTASLTHAQVEPGSLKARIKHKRLVACRPAYMAYDGESPCVLEVRVE